VAKLAFLGLGLMGTPMATRLLEAGRDLTVWNRTTEKTRPLADQGASTPSQAAAGVEAVITMVDAPVRGSVPEAGAGRRAIYVGADQSDFERAEPIRAPLGTLHHVGGPGAGAATKVVVNSTLGAAIAAFGEALALGETLGLDRSALLDVLTIHRAETFPYERGPRTAGCAGRVGHHGRTR
jgi:3-hydroxyisobutyrate dehydrogenase